MPSHLRPRPGTASAVGRSPIGRRVGSQCNFDQSSIVARMSSRAMQNGRSWVTKRNLGQKNETLAQNTGFPALFQSVSIERGVKFGKIFSAWQTILLRHTGDSQKTVLLAKRAPQGRSHLVNHLGLAAYHIARYGRRAPREAQPCMGIRPVTWHRRRRSSAPPVWLVRTRVASTGCAREVHTVLVCGLQTLVYPAVCGAVRPLSGACMALRAAEVAVAACFRWVDGSGLKLEASDTCTSFACESGL